MRKSRLLGHGYTYYHIISRVNHRAFWMMERKSGLYSLCAMRNCWAVVMW